MVKSWILDYSTPTSLETSSAVANVGYIREVLVVRKGVETPIEILTSRQTTNSSKVVNALFDVGVTRVGFKEQEDLDLSLVKLKGEFFTVIVEGFEIEDIEAKNLGEFNGVFVFESTNLEPAITYNQIEVYSLTTDGYTAGEIIGKLVVGSEFRNLQYTTTNNNVSYVEDIGTANGLYNKKGTVFGRDDFQGIRLVSAFCNGEGISKPYILEEIKVLTQASNLKMLGTSLAWNINDTQLVDAVNTNFITENYVTTGLITSFEYNVSLGTDNSAFASSLDVKVSTPVFKIKMEITA